MPVGIGGWFRSGGTRMRVDYWRVSQAKYLGTQRSMWVSRHLNQWAGPMDPFKDPCRSANLHGHNHSTLQQRRGY